MYAILYILYIKSALMHVSGVPEQCWRFPLSDTQIQEPKGVESGGETSKVCSAGMLQEQDWESPL